MNTVGLMVCVSRSSSPSSRSVKFRPMLQKHFRTLLIRIITLFQLGVRYTREFSDCLHYFFFYRHATNLHMPLIRVIVEAINIRHDVRHPLLFILFGLVDISVSSFSEQSVLSPEAIDMPTSTGSILPFRFQSITPLPPPLHAS